MKRIIKYISIVTLTLILFSGCDESFLELSNPNEIDAETFFESVENLNLALNAVYSSAAGFELYGGEFFVKCLYGKGFTADQDWTGHNDWNHFYQHENVPEDGLDNLFWRSWWRVVARANDFLTNADKFLEERTSSAASVEKVNQMKGQAYFFRAYAYFHLVRLWGEGNPVENGSSLGVPNILEVATSIDDMKASRATIAENYTQIIADLNQAITLLPPSWDGTDLARVDSWAAKGILSRVYMTQENWSDAQSTLEDIINNGGFDLVATEDYNGLFHGETEFSEESLFEFNFSEDLAENTWNGGLGSNVALMIAPYTTGWSNVFPHDENIRRFGSDPRLHVCALEPGVDSVYHNNDGKIAVPKFPKGELGWSFHKYVPTENSVYATNRNYGANIHVIRLADVYLMYAELMNHQGSDGVASEYMNKVRRRAYGFDPNTPEASVDYTGLAGNQLRDSIREERFRELFGEGLRWYDIKRWKIGDVEAARYGAVQSGNINFEPKDYYLPIPQPEIDNNENMVQNNGFN